MHADYLCTSSLSVMHLIWDSDKLIVVPYQGTNIPVFCDKSFTFVLLQHVSASHKDLNIDGTSKSPFQVHKMQA